MVLFYFQLSYFIIPNMRPEHVRDLTKILFLDIETVPQTFQWSQLDERTAQLFSDKTRYDQERQEKTA